MESYEPSLYINKYLDYLKFQKNYSDYTIESYENDINEYLVVVVECVNL